MTIEEKIFELFENWQWAARWFRQGEVIICADGKTRAVRNIHKTFCPVNVQSLGCTGEGIDGKCHWIGWDLDVGHGAKQFGSTSAAILAGRMIKKVAGPATEIRLSKSGIGVHVRHLCQYDTMKLGIERAKEIVSFAGVTRMDPTSISRQAHWLWSEKPGENGFKIIEEYQ